MHPHTHPHPHTLRYPHRVGIYLRLVVFGTLEVREVWKNVLEFLLFISRLQPEERRNEVGEAEQLGYDRVPPADQLEEGLATRVPVR